MTAPNVIIVEELKRGCSWKRFYSLGTAEFLERRVRSLGWKRLASAAMLAVLSSAAIVSAADMNKTLRIALNAADSGFDPVLVNNTSSNSITEQIYEPLLTYDYLARPAKLVPNTAGAMPEVSENGRVWLVRLKPGIVFQADPAFKGRRRELTVDDYVYTFKRLMDPKVRSPWQFMVDGKIAGLDALAAEAKKTGRFDYDAKVPGLEVVDPHTLRIGLNETDYNFGYFIAMPATAAQAREVVEAYEDTNAHPVGTGPYMLKKWVRGSKIVLEANPDYRDVRWDFQPSSDPYDRQLVAEMRGKKIPQIGVVEISVMDEGQSRWLAFNNGELDFVAIPPEFAPKALVGDKLAPDLLRQGHRLQRVIAPSVTYALFNFRDSIVGGFSKEKTALRRAIAMAVDTNELIAVVARGQAIAAKTLIPPGVVGYDPHYQSMTKFDVPLANKLLDQFGYRKGPDGYRTLPDGKPLTLLMSLQTTAFDRDFSELWKKSMDRIAVRIEFKPQKYSENQRAAKACQLMMWRDGWDADYPDGENFVQLLYGPNTGQSNWGCYENPAYDKLYEAAKKLPDSPERNLLYAQMTHQMEVDAALRLGVHPIRNYIVRPEVKGYKKHPVIIVELKYLDVMR